MEEINSMKSPLVVYQTINSHSIPPYLSKNPSSLAFVLVNYFYVCCGKIRMLQTLEASDISEVLIENFVKPWSLFKTMAALSFRFSIFFVKCMSDPLSLFFHLFSSP